MQNRRDFLKSSLVGGAVAGSILSPIQLLANEVETKLTILHTNDVHSHIEPFADDDKKYPGLGGAEYRATIIENIRKKSDNVLVFDAGDIFQGTPYFNFFHGDLE
ncbi:MAG TPA: twin-arginine translocation signal domain-containing protein, partial [Chitinophagales bacterium]|nr:twin-arginine translocation signal domain-containing protein [Chitinophagales bacterium]